MKAVAGWAYAIPRDVSGEATDFQARSPRFNGFHSPDGWGASHCIPDWTGLPWVSCEVEDAIRDACEARKQGLDALSETLAGAHYASRGADQRIAHWTTVFRMRVATRSISRNLGRLDLRQLADHAMRNP